VFWMSVLGALGWSAALCAFVQRDGRTASTVIGLVAAAALVALAVRGLLADRAYALEQVDAAIPRRVASIDIVDYMARQQVRRPLFHITDDRWLDATCIILQAYKHHPNLAVDRRSVPVFGEALAPSGDEDVEVFITDSDQLPALPLQGSSQLISAHDGVFVHVSPLTSARQ